MNLPIQFPDHADVIREEAARFQALSDEERIRALDECFRLYLEQIEASDRADELRALAEEEERKEKEAIWDFINRHGGPVLSE